MDTHPSDMKGTILAVDDTPTNLRIQLEILTEDGYTVRAAPSGELALNFVVH